MKSQEKIWNITLQFTNDIGVLRNQRNKLNVVEVYYISYLIRLLSTDGVYGSD